ncbi:MAG: hypothetical protein V1809_06975 [Planctomycetota bacterium]
MPDTKALDEKAKKLKGLVAARKAKAKPGELAKDSDFRYLRKRMKRAQRALNQATGKKLKFKQPKTEGQAAAPAPAPKA